MKEQLILKHLSIDDLSATPKYQQLANSIMKAIEEGKIEQDRILPSINELSFEFEISRDTAERAYKLLRKLHILGSVPGKGYYVKNAAFRQPTRIFLLFNKLSAHKKIIYDSLVGALGEQVAIDFYVYNNDFSLFRKLVTRRMEDYSHCVIIAHFIEGGENASQVINTIPKEKLILLDKKIPAVTGDFAAVYENFEKDIYQALEQALKPLKKYPTLKILFPENSYYPEEILKGFSSFCSQHGFVGKVVHDIARETIKSGEAYISVMEADLVTLIERINAQKLKIGHQVGIISYNETPLKKIILDGITTISTDFQKMGELAAALILDKSTRQIEVPFSIILRKSL
jgi:DNA-binding transcriptional regulator YhcF (GntR family)